MRNSVSIHVWGPGCETTPIKTSLWRGIVWLHADGKTETVCYYHGHIDTRLPTTTKEGLEHASAKLKLITQRNCTIGASNTLHILLFRYDDGESLNAGSMPCRAAFLEPQVAIGTNKSVVKLQVENKLPVVRSVKRQHRETRHGTPLLQQNPFSSQNHYPASSFM